MTASSACPPSPALGAGMRSTGSPLLPAPRSHPCPGTPPPSSWGGGQAGNAFVRQSKPGCGDRTTGCRGGLRAGLIRGPRLPAEMPTTRCASRCHWSLCHRLRPMAARAPGQPPHRAARKGDYVVLSGRGFCSVTRGRGTQRTRTVGGWAVEGKSHWGARWATSGRP